MTMKGKKLVLIVEAERFDPGMAPPIGGFEVGHGTIPDSLGGPGQFTVTAVFNEQALYLCRSDGTAVHVTLGTLSSAILIALSSLEGVRPAPATPTTVVRQKGRGGP
jgi:hypothetical protein